MESENIDPENCSQQKFSRFFLIPWYMYLYNKLCRFVSYYNDQLDGTNAQLSCFLSVLRCFHKQYMQINKDLDEHLI